MGLCLNLKKLIGLELDLQDLNHLDLVCLDWFKVKLPFDLLAEPEVSNYVKYFSSRSFAGKNL